MRISFCCVLLVACPSTMGREADLPNLDDSPLWRVEGRTPNAPLQSTRLTIPGTGYSADQLERTTDGFQFRFVGESFEWRGTCEQRSRCTCHDQDQAQSRLTLAPDGSGALTIAGIRHEVVATRELHASGKITETPAGFEFRRDDRAVAGVDVMNDGFIHMRDDIAGAERDATFCAAVALLLAYPDALSTGPGT